MIEPLEARVAPAGVTFAYTDVDGDAVTVKISKGTLSDVVFDFRSEGLGQQLESIDLGGKAAFQGATITITAVAAAGLGNGFVNVGYINASGIDLLLVKVKGDLARIEVGDSNLTTSGLGTLDLQSFHRMGGSTSDQDPFNGGLDTGSHVSGALKKLMVKTDFGSGGLYVDQLGAVVIGGSLLGNMNPADITNIDNSGEIYSATTIGAIKIGRDIRGGAGDYSGAIVAVGKITSITVGGSLIGGSGPSSSGAIYAGSIGKITIGGDIQGGPGSVGSGSIIAAESILGVTVVGSIFGGNGGSYSGAISAGTTLGATKIGRSVSGGEGVNSGLIQAFGDLTSVTIGGSLIGGDGPENDSFSGAVSVGGKINVVTITGDLRGGAAHTSGVISSGGTIAKVLIKGSIIGGPADNSGEIYSGFDLGIVQINGSLIGGSNMGFPVAESGYIEGGRIAKIIIGGSIVAGFDDGSGLTKSGEIRAAEDLGILSVKGNLQGNATHAVYITGAGQVFQTLTDVAIKSIVIGGNVEFAEILAGYDTDTVLNNRGKGINGDAQIGSVVVGGNWRASNLIAGAKTTDAYFGNADDSSLVGTSPTIASKISSVIIKGQAFGSTDPDDPATYGIIAQQLGSIKASFSLALNPNAANDLFPAAKVIGWTRGTPNPDGFDFHAFEVT